MLSIFIGFAVVLATSVFCYIHTLHRYWSVRQVPGPKPTFLLGNVSMVKSESLSKIYLDIYKSYQNVPYVGLYKLFSPILLLRQVSIVNKIFSEEHNMFLDPKCKSTAFFISSLKNERLGQETCKFNSSQILIPENFDIKQIEVLFPLFQKVGAELVQYIQTELIIDTKAVFSSKGLSQKLIIQSIGVCMLGANGIPMCDTGFLESTLCPEADSDFKNQFMNIGHNDDVISSYFLFIINKLKDGVKLNNLAAKYISSHKNGFLSNIYEVGSALMNYTLCEIALQPRIQYLLKNEIRMILMKYRYSLTFDAIQEMNFLNCVIKEVIRLHPPVKYLEWICSKNYTLSANKKQHNTTIVVENGTTIVIPIHGIQLDQQYFSNPTSFLPQRFLRRKNAQNEDISPHLWGNINELTTVFYIKLGIVFITSTFLIEMDDKGSSSMTSDEIFPDIKDSIWLKFSPRHRKTCRRNK